MLPSDHLPKERLQAPILNEAEQAHLASCVRCRGERRIAERGLPLQARASQGVPYVLGRWLGSGGMGVVYEARHEALGTRHAIKLLRVPDPQLRARLLREGRLQSRLVHRNIVPIDEVIELDGAPALVMPFVEGPTLAQVLSKRRLPEPVALALFREVVSGVAEIHRARLVHRDLKPANILLELLPSEVVPRVSDFGLAKALAASESTLQTGTGAMMGTVAYAAPEQLLDAARAGPAADVFSLGALLYELLTGKQAFHSLGREVLPALQPLPLALASLVARCLSLDPHERPPDAMALLALLPEVPAVDLGPWCRLAPHQPVLVLPSERDRFVGRERELDTLGKLLSAGHRRVTLTGPAGVGKTRLLLRLGYLWGPSYRGGALWVDTGARPQPQGPMLLLLDAPGPEMEPLIEVWLRDNPELVVLVARTEPLGTEPVLPLEGLLPEDAVTLFLARAPEVKGAEAAQIRALVERLGGIPLAIELAAARLRKAPLQEVLASDSLWDGLSAAAEVTLAQLSLFAADFSLEAAEAVVDLSMLEDLPWVPDVLQELCESGLVRSVEQRMHLPGLVRAHAERRLGQDSAARLRHARHFARHGAVLEQEARDIQLAAERMRADGQDELASVLQRLLTR